MTSIQVRDVYHEFSSHPGRQGGPDPDRPQRQEAAPQELRPAPGPAEAGQVGRRRGHRGRHHRVRRRRDRQPRPAPDDARLGRRDRRDRPDRRARRRLPGRRACRAAAHRRHPGRRHLHARAQGQLHGREHARRPDDQLRQADHRDRDRRHHRAGGGALAGGRDPGRASSACSPPPARRLVAGDRPPPAAPALPPNMLDMPIEELDLPMRAYNSLKRNNIVKVGQLLQLQDEDLLRMRNFGKKSLDEMKERLRMRGFLPPDDGRRRVRRRSPRTTTSRRRPGRGREPEPWPTASTAASWAARPARAWRSTRT